MRSRFSKIYSELFGIGFVIAACVTASSAQAIERAGFGASPAAIQGAVDQFRADLGALNPNNGQSFSSGRREINWDGVPDNFSAPNALPPDFFNVNSPRGAVFTSTVGPVLTGGPQQPFVVSSTTASGVPVRFGNINPTYATEFQTFSAQRLFTTTPGSNVVEINFFIPGTNIPATVNGFGAVFADIDGQTTFMQFYDEKGKILPTPNGPIIAFDKGLTFEGISFNDGTRISKVQLILGNAALSATNTDGVNGVDVVALDDFIYGEPHAMEYHAGDYDGDGTPDISVFRPSTGTWFVLNSGSNTISQANWGQQGDVPVQGDYDGDKRSDITVFRPTTGQWFTFRSSDSQASITTWGVAGDKPLSGDFDKDGKTDIAVFRPSDGVNYVVRSSNGQPQLTQFGAAGDVPVLAGP